MSRSESRRPLPFQQNLYLPCWKKPEKDVSGGTNSVIKKIGLDFICFEIEANSGS